MNGFRKGFTPFDKAFSPEHSRMVRASGCLCGSIYVVMFKKGIVRSP